MERLYTKELLPLETIKRMSSKERGQLLSVLRKTYRAAFKEYKRLIAVNNAPEDGYLTESEYIIYRDTQAEIRRILRVTRRETRREGK